MAHSPETKLASRHAVAPFVEQFLFGQPGFDVALVRRVHLHVGVQAAQAVGLVANSTLRQLEKLSAASNPATPW
jgi:hypothetical protein